MRRNTGTRVLAGVSSGCMKSYSHLLDMAFTIISNEEDYTKIPYEDIMEALGRRVHSLARHPEIEAFGCCETIEEEDV